MQIDDLTVGEAKQLAAMSGGATAIPAVGRWKIGEKYLVLVAATFYTGRLVAVDEHEIALADAAWVADTGRFAQAIATGVVEEVEPCPEGEALLGRGAMVAAFIWKHELPRGVK